MTPEQRRIEINKCLDLVEALDAAWEPWRELGVKIEAPLPDTAWRIAEAYIDEVEDKLKVWSELQWWLDLNSKGLLSYATKSGESKAYTLKTRADFLDYLDAEYPVEVQP